MVKGENFVKMSGYLMYPELKTTGNGYQLFKGKIAVPIECERAGETVNTKIFYNLSAWGTTAEALAELVAETPIEITGSLNVRQYDGKCRHCGGSDKKYWTEVQINNFSTKL